MTDFDLDRFVSRPGRNSERTFWVYVALSVIAHLALMTWLLPGGFISPESAPAILVRLVNPGADEAGGGGGIGGGEPAGGPAEPAAVAKAPASAPSAAPQAPPLPTVSPIKAEPEPAAEPDPAPEPAPAVDPGAVHGDGAAEGGGFTAPGGSGDGSGPGGPGVGSGGPGGSGIGNGGQGPAGLPDEYQARVSSRIQRKQLYPEAYRTRLLRGRVRVKFTIHSDGHITDVSIVQSSGYPLMDQAALEAVEKAAPFPPFPPGIDLPQYIIKMSLNFTPPR